MITLLMICMVSAALALCVFLNLAFFGWCRRELRAREEMRERAEAAARRIAGLEERLAAMGQAREGQAG